MGYCDQQVWTLQMPASYPIGNLLKAVVEESCREDVGVVPQSGGGDANEISPPAASKAQQDRGKVHPCLEEMEPADVSFPVSRNGQHQDKETSTNQNQPLRSHRPMARVLHG